MKSALMIILTCISGQALASAGHLSAAPSQSSANHHGSANADQSTATIWQLDTDLVYRQKSGPNMLGFLPTNQHQESAGLRLDHADLSVQRPLPETLPQAINSDAMFGKLALAYHSGSSELSEAWVRNDWHTHQLQLTAGKYLPRIGFLNHQHQHAQTFIQSPLVNKVYWGDQLADAGINLQLQQQFAGWQINHSLNLLGGDHLNSKKNTLAGLYQLELSQRFAELEVTALANGYYADVNDRGMFLFDLSSNTHVHTNSGFTEFFDGKIQHWGAGIQLSYPMNHLGQLSYQGEYSQRQEDGRLYSRSNSASSDIAELTLNSQGQYHQLWWSNSSHQLQLGMRYDYLYSDTEVSNTSDNKLDDSRLNNAGNKPQRLTWMATMQLSRYQKMQLLYSDGQGWQSYPARLEIHLQQSFRF